MAAKKAIRRIKLTDLSASAQAQIKSEQGVETEHKLNVSSKDKRTFDGIVFGSNLEMRIFKALLELFPRDRIHMQVPFILQPSCHDSSGNKYRPISYVADFVLGEPRAHEDDPLLPGQFVLDAKGMETPVYKIKCKMFAYRYHRPIVEVGSIIALHEVLLKSKLIKPDQCKASKPSTRSSSKRSSKSAPSSSAATEVTLAKFLTSLSDSSALPGIET